MAQEFRTGDWDSYTMAYEDPHVRIEEMEQEVAVVDSALDALIDAGIIAHKNYDGEKLLAHRAAVAETFEIPWTAISHRMQRLIYAVNAVHRPAHMIAAGIFCGNTFISNAGAAVGPGASYTADECLGVEIKPEEAERAERNVRTIDPTGVAHIVAADGIQIARDYPHSIDLLYLDADGTEETGKGVYLDILHAAWDKMPSGAIILAHNSVNCADRLQHYLKFVQDPANCSASVNVIFDPEGLEVSAKK
ncbi:MAG: class I SAM-dependent methyltransferase [Planctomycetota bacterium]|jgi:predicted O-methyltransferase YrrM